MCESKVSIPVLWDGTGNFRNGEYYAVCSDSIIGGTVSKPSGPYIPSYGRTFVDTLLIKDPVAGIFFTTLTAEEYTALVDSAIASTATNVIDWIGGEDVPAGNTITNSALVGIEILSINKGGFTIYAYTHDAVDGKLDLTDSGGISDGEPIQIIYRIPT